MSPRADSYGTMAYSSPSIDNADADAPDDYEYNDDNHVSNATGNTTTSSAAAAGLSKDEFHHNPYTLKITNSKYRYYVQIDDAIERIGIGKFQYSILFAAGLCFMADSMEVLLLSFLSVVLKHEWYLTEHQMDSIFAVVFAGALIGTLLLGPAGDIYGRKPIFILTAFIIAISGVVTAFCTNYTQLVIARFFVGFGVGGLTVPFDTLGEFLPTKSRGKNLLYIEFFWTFGTLSVPLLAYLTLDTTNGGGGGDGEDGESHWQLFVILCSVPCFISTALGVILVPESPRWLLESTSHLEDDETGSNKAIDILRYAALKNGISQKVIDEELFPPGTRLITSWKDVSSIQLSQSLTQHSHSHSHDESMIAHTSDNKSNEGGDGGFKELFNSPSRTRLTLLLWSTWFGLGFLYYGVILAVSIVFTNEEEMEDEANGGNGNGNGSYDFDYVAIFISASSEIFGLLIVLYTIDKFGRIPSQTISYRIGGTATFLMGILYFIFYNISASNDNNEVDIAYFHRYMLIGLAFIARMAMMGASCTTWVSTSEILTTDIRSTGHGSANAMARLGGFISPFIITLGNSLWLIGIIVLIVSLLTAEFASRLPETTGRSMGDISSPSSSNNNDKKTRLMMDDDNDNDNDDNNSDIVSVASSTPSTAKRKGLNRIEAMEVTTPSIDEEDDTNVVSQSILPPSAVPSTRRNGSNSSTATIATESATSYHELL